MENTSEKEIKTQKFDEHKVCSQHSNKPIEYICVNRNTDNIYFCRDCAVGKDQTQLIRVQEIIQNDPKKIIQNWPVFQHSIVSDFKKKIKVVKDRIPLMFDEFISEIQGKLNELKDHLLYQVKQINDQFMFLYNTYSSKKKFMESYNNGNKADIIKLIEDKINKKSSITESFQEFIEQIRTVAEYKSFGVLQSEFDKAITKFQEEDLTQCNYADSERPKKPQVEQEEETMDKFVEKMKKELSDMNIKFMADLVSCYYRFNNHSTKRSFKYYIFFKINKIFLNRKPLQNLI